MESTLPESSIRERRVLVVDDRVESAEQLGVLLNLAGYEARLTCSALDALSVAKAFLPQVVLMDIGLPGMDGYDLASLLRAQPELEGCRFIAVTGRSGEAAVARSVAARFEAHLTKPVHAEHLLDVIARHRLGKQHRP
jgi:CheY-like chemotaxis protein